MFVSFRKEKASGFGLLPDYVPARAQGRCEVGAALWRWTSTRYACPRRKRLEMREKKYLNPRQDLLFAFCGKIFEE